MLYIDNIKDKSSQILYLNGEKYQFMSELYNGTACEYNGKIVLNNRYLNYVDHNFK